VSNNIIIVGAGPVGLVAGALLAALNYPVNIIEANHKDFILKDSKALALSNSTVFILKKLDIWGDLLKKATPINEIHVSQKNTFGRTLFKADDYDEDALGYIVSYADLINLLKRRIEGLQNAHIFFNTKLENVENFKDSNKIFIKNDGKEKELSFNLLVLADGGKSNIAGIDLIREEKDLNHIALVSLVKSKKPHHGRAYERFTKNGPIALLPKGFNNFTLVWTGPKKYIDEIANLNKDAFLDTLRENFGRRAGEFIDTNEKSIFVLKSSILKNISTPYVVAIGNASQIIHPVAGQGLNIGMRDALELAKFVEKHLGDSFSKNMLLDFNRIQKNKSSDIINITDQLSSIFLNNFFGFNYLRGITLSAFDALPPIKRKFVRKMSYGD
jgi:2-octaprenyl-6-methoxyphenol hydroxylase